MDLDFIDISLQSTTKISNALAKIGFLRQPKARRHFTHPENNLSIEFPSGPLMIGDEAVVINSLESITTDSGTLRLLNPTDCVKDRLANYYYFKDKQCLYQAILVATTHPINLGLLKSWHQLENLPEEYNQFISLLKSSSILY